MCMISYMIASYLLYEIGLWYDMYQWYKGNISHMNSYTYDIIGNLIYMINKACIQIWNHRVSRFQMDCTVTVTSTQKSVPLAPPRPPLPQRSRRSPAQGSSSAIELAGGPAPVPLAGRRRLSERSHQTLAPARPAGGPAPAAGTSRYSDGHCHDPSHDSGTP